MTSPNSPRPILCRSNTLFGGESASSPTGWARLWFSSRVLFKTVYTLICRVLGVVVVVFRRDWARTAELKCSPPDGRTGGSWPADPHRDVGGLQRQVDDTEHVRLDRVEVHGVLQAGHERGHDFVGVIAGRLNRRSTARPMKV